MHQTCTVNISTQTCTVNISCIYFPFFYASINTCVSFLYSYKFYVFVNLHFKLYILILIMTMMTIITVCQASGQALYRNYLI